MPVSIIIPVLNEENSIRTTLERLQLFRQQGNEVIVVDAGSKEFGGRNKESGCGYL